ncbi:MAG: rRNA-processing protein bfr2 [Claussenomyces sp. TS43310]|nr:MAG: rRNA-processing protein bfr2 [Claussenomyces sp. TS43310]
MGKFKSLAQQIAELDEPVPRDFDPEENGAAESSGEESGSQDSGDELAGTEHYLDVGQSKIRKLDDAALGPQYAGARVSREAVLGVSDDEVPGFDDEDNDDHGEGAETFADPDNVDLDVEEDGIIDSSDAFGDSDSGKFKDFTFRGSAKPREVNGVRRQKKSAADFMSSSEDEQSENSLDGAMDDGSTTSDHDDGFDEDTGDDSSIDGGARINGKEISSSGSEIDTDDEREMAADDERKDEQSRRAELRKIMNEEQKTVISTISEAAKADAEKGSAVKQQRKVFDSLLNIRIRLQKALVATNSMAVLDERGEDGDAPPYAAAEEAAVKLLNGLNAMRHEMAKPGTDGADSRKRKREVNIMDSSAEIWQTLQTSESAAMQLRQATLEKWSSKVRGATANPISRRLNTSAVSQTIVGVLEEHLSNPERLIKRTKMPRSCAPVQSKAKVTEDANIYDDADFYQLLLKELVDQRMTEAATAPGGTDRVVAQWTAVKEAKTRRNVDTKASKGRKMKFTVHEKLQNFMAPEDRRNWEQDAIDRFFSTLLGQQMNLGEDAVDSDGEDGRPLAEEALMLFRS